MRILQLGKFHPIKGGIEKVMYDLTVGLSGRGLHCDMLCASVDNKSHTVKLCDCGNIIAKSSTIKLSGVMISPLLISELIRKKGNYDIIHIHHPDPMAALALLISNFKGKVILHWHSDILRQKMLLKFYKPLQSWLIKRADLIVGTTPVYVKESPFLLSEQHKISHLIIGVDPLGYNKEKVSLIRSKYAEKKIIFALGRFVEYKGFKYLVESSKLLPDDYIVLIGGTGPLEEKLIKQIDDNKLQEKVHLLGYLSDKDLSDYYNACDLFCLSSIWKTEAFAIVQIEAMSCGKPIVATKIPNSGVSWVNEDGVSGINVDPENPRGLAEAIIKILSNPELYNKYSKGATLRFNETFRKDIMINKCIDIYNSIL